MRGIIFFLVIGALLALAVRSSAQRCAVSSCQPGDPRLPRVWLNTTHTSSYVEGLSFRVYGRKPDGQAFEQAYTEINISRIREQQSLDGSPHCDKDDLYSGSWNGKYNILQDLDWSQLCCEGSISWMMMDNFVNRSTATMTVTNPDIPSFVAKFHMHLVNETIVQHVNGTAGTNNIPYDVVYSNTSQKLTFEMANWPWASLNATANPSGLPSYVKFFLLAKAQLDQPGTLGYWNQVNMVSYNATSATTFIAMSFLKIITLDDRDFTTSNKDDGEEPQLTHDVEGVLVPAIIVACKGSNLIDTPYWTNLTYDPSLLALFTGTDEVGGKNQKGRLNPAAYAVPIAVVAAVIVVAALILFVPALHNRVFKRETLAAPSLEDPSFARATTSKPTTVQPKSSTPSAHASRSSWVRSKTVEHDE